MPQPPFDRTISEGSGDGAGLKSEGNTFSRPFGEDFLQDVISVQWNSGLFFATDHGSDGVPQIFHSKGGKEWKGPAAVSKSDFEDGTGGTPHGGPEILSAVGGKIHDGEQGKIFVVCGLYAYHPPEVPEATNSHTVLAYSFDGEEWTSPRLPYSYFDDDKFLNVDIDIEVDNVMFLPEEKLFYADVFYANGVWKREILTSGTGTEWSVSHSFAIDEEAAPDNPPFVCDFVKLALQNQDDNGYTGATNPQTGTVLKFSNVKSAPGNMGGSIRWDNPVRRNDVPIDIPGLTVDGLCFAGGSFLVSGHFSTKAGAIYRSGDDGKTWKKVKDVDTTHSLDRGVLCGGA